MKIEVAKAIINAADEIGNIEMRLYEGYSGRWMCGETTTGVVYDNESSLLQAVGLAAASLKQAELEAHNRDTLTVEEFLSDIRRTNRDSMGRSGIIY
jgi:hypothetical protein